MSNEQEHDPDGSAAGAHLYRDPNFRNTGGNSFRDSLFARWDSLARSGVFIVLCLLVVLAVGGALWMAHIRGRIHQFTTTQEGPEQATATVRPGGQDIVHLSRVEVSGSIAPEFTSATIVPGDGMLLLQALLTLPGQGDLPILVGTREADLVTAGSNVLGADFSVLVSLREASHWSAPLELVAGIPAAEQNMIILPGGSRSEADFSPDVPSKSGALTHTGVESKVSASLTGRGLELVMSVKNTSNDPRAVSMVWRPDFRSPQTGLKSLYVLPPARAAGSGPRSSEEHLGLHDYDQTFSALQHSYLSAGPEVRLRNQADGYSIRLTALTPSIRSVHIKAGANDDGVLIAFSTASGSKPDEMRSVLAPGESLVWRLRVDALLNATDTTPAL